MPGISRRLCHLCERTCCALASAFPRVGVNMLTAWGLYVHLFRLCNEFYQGTTRLIYVVVACTFYGLATWAYLSTIHVGAGSPLEIPGFPVKLSDLENGPAIVPPCVERNVTAKENGMMRYCSKCECWKPDRAHHCSSCRRCILRMDHHCPWFATCIGFRNQKFFLQFLTYVSLFCMTCLASSGYAVYTYLYTLDSQMNVFLPLNWVALLVVSFTMGLAVTIFAVYSLYIAARNKTVLEALEPMRYKSSLPSRSFRYREAPSSTSIGNIFDLGWYENLRQLLGSELWEWFVPIRSTVGDGTSFPIDQALYTQIQRAGAAEQEMLDREYQYRQNQRVLQGHPAGTSTPELEPESFDDLDYYAKPYSENIPLARY